MTKKNEQPTLELENFGSIITIRRTNNCLGSLMDFGEKGIFCPSYGRVDTFGVTPEYAKAHNEALDKAMVEGLTKNCEIGQGGMFYLTEHKNFPHPTKRYKITTFTGVVVSDNCRVETTGKKNRFGGFHLKVYFQAGGKSFEGRNNGDDQLVRFKRVK